MALGRPPQLQTKAAASAVDLLTIAKPRLAHVDRKLLSVMSRMMLLPRLSDVAVP